MDITKFDEVTLKALKCDSYEIIAMHNQNINVINEELKRREIAKASTTAVPPVPPLQAPAQAETTTP